MNRIKDLSIGKRFAIILGVAFIFIVMAELVGIANSRRLANKISLRYETVSRPLAATADARGEFNAMRTALHDLSHDFNTAIQKRQFAEESRQHLVNYEQHINFYKNVLDTYGTGDPYEQEAVDYLYEQLAPLREYVEYIISVAEKTGHEADAVRILRSDFFGTAEEISLELERLTHILDAQSKTANIRAGALYYEGVIVLSVIMVTCVTVLVLATYAFSRSIIKPMREMSSIARELSEGNLDAAVISYHSKDELGILADCLRHLDQVIKNIINDIQAMTQHQSEGDYEYMIESDRYRGSYRNVVSGINGMMQMTVEDLKTIVAYLQGLKRGGFIDKIKRFPGKKAVISDSIDELMGHLHFDVLTGVYNRRYLEETLNILLKTMRRSGSGMMSVLMIDVDYFKKYNDTYGHAAGDNCLGTVAKTIQGSLSRQSDIVARYGGEEFTVVLPDTDREGARIVAKRILENMRKQNIPHEKNEVAKCVTLSIGIATGDVKDMQTGMEYINRADAVLYQSKQNGRNRYTFCEMAD